MTECRFCRALADRVKTPEAWHKEHDLHGGHKTEKADHPSGNWIWLICSCGAKYLTIKNSKEKVNEQQE